MIYTSQGSRVRGRDDLNYTSYIDRLLLYKSNEIDEEDLSGPVNTNISEDDNISKIAVNFLLKLVNETFLSLPIIDCTSITQIQVEQRQDPSLVYNDNDRDQNYKDACFIDWPNAKLIQNSASNSNLNYSNLKTQASEISLSNLFESNSFLKNPDPFLSLSLSSKSPTVTKIALKHLNDNNSNIHDLPSSSLFDISNINPNSTIDSYYHLAKLTYLSISTILSICGALINLFIIFIIIFNTKQKRISLIRGNTIGQNNLLLFQLTLTGLLLAGYVLIDNFSIKYETKAWNNIYAFSQTTADIQDNLSLLNFHKYALNQQQDELFQRSIGNDISPLQLSSFLSPILFHSNNKLSCDTFDSKVFPKQDSRKSNLRTQPQNDDDNYDSNETFKDHQLHSTSLIFVYNTRRDSTKLDDLISNDNNLKIVNNSNNSNNISREKTWYLHGGGNIKLIDLNGVLKSISVADSNCNNLDKEFFNKERRKVRQTRGSQQEPAKVPIYSNFNTNYSNKFVRLYILSLISFLMNVVASVHIWTVAALAYDRYCAIAYPLQYLRSIHASRTKTFLIISWTLSIILNLLLPVFMNQINSHGMIQRTSLEPTHLNQFEAEEDWFMGSVFNEKNTNDFEGAESIKDINNGYKNKEKCQFMTRRMAKQVMSSKNYEYPGSFLEEFFKYRSKLHDETFREYDSIYNEDSYLEQVVKREKLKMNLILDISIKFIELSSKSMKLKDSIQKKLDNIKIDQANRTSFIALLIVFSLFSFVIIILIPLLIISVCNISIYRIIKVHERRLSVSSGNNNSTSMSNAYNNNICNNCLNNNNNNNNIGNQRFSHDLKKQGMVDDEKGEANSVTSLLFNRFFGANFAQKTLCQQPDTGSFIQDQESCDFHQQNKCLLKCDKNCDCDKLTNNKLEYHNKSESQSNIVNRSKRLITRRDSYQVLTKSNGDELRDKGDESSVREKNCMTSKTKKKVSSSCDSILFDQNQQPSRAKLKRKVSDHVPLYSRKSSNTSHTEDLETDARSNIDTPITMYFDGIKYESGSIMNQLKMAGLSFAGIAIRKSFGNRNTLYKSCSLCNIYKQQHGSSISRCSVETASPISNCNKHNKYINCTYKYRDHQNNKFTCQLADNDSDNMQHAASNTNLVFHPHNGRLPTTFGTKSSAFNVVIWLILTMLIFALPHFLLVTVDRIARLNASQDVQLEAIGHDQDELKFYGHRLNAILKFVLESKLDVPNSKILEADFSLSNITCKNEQSFLQMSSLWLSCLCRILFLAMVPLNGWLYGIKSRSLRTKIRIVLKRYINERQASIEINKRQRSVSSMRSRDSSFANLQSINSHQISCCNCSQSRPVERSFRRCSSFGTTIRHSDTPNYLKNARSLQSQVHLINSDSSDIIESVRSSKIPNDTSIKFVIGEYNNPDNLSSNNQVQNASVNSSLTSSRRSILSTNTSTTTSNSQFAIQSLLEQKCSDSNDSENYSFNQSDLESKFTDLLNRFESSATDSNLLLLKSSKSADVGDKGELNISLEGEQIISDLPSTDIMDAQTSLTPTRENNREPRHVCLGDGQLEKISCGQKTCGIDRRHSNTEISSSKKDHLLNHGETTRFDRNIKRSISDFRLIITPVCEQRADQYNESKAQLEESLLDKRSSIDSSCCADDKTCQSNSVKPIGGRKSLRTLSNWCMELRYSLTKVLSSASAVILSNAPSSAPPIGDGHFSVIDFDSCRCESTSRGSMDSNISIRDQSRLGLLKRASFENERHSNPTYNWIQNLPSPNNISKTSMRASYTMNNIDMKMKRYEDCTLKCRCSKHQSSHLKGNFCEKTKRSNSIMEQSQTFLKPPSFLKLIFDPNNPGATYSSSSALSPIKECSSTQHSYASSQSSLNNSQTQQHRKLSLNNSSPKASLAATTIVTQVDSKNEIETRLVKDEKGE